MNVTIKEIKNLDTLLNWRGEVIANVFGVTATRELMDANRRYYSEHLNDGTHIALEAVGEDGPAGCGAICLTEELPSPDNPSGRCAYLMNIYVRDRFRNRGIGHSIVRRLVETACELGCDKIYLETTDGAKSLYNSIGFKELPGIMKYADVHNSES